MWTWGWSTTLTRTTLLQVGRLFVSQVIRTGQLWSLAIYRSLKYWSLVSRTSASINQPEIRMPDGCLYFSPTERSCQGSDGVWGHVDVYI